MNTTASPKQFCTFFLNGFFFGVEVLNVQEVIRYQEMTRVPLAPCTVQGLINLRGQIVTAIDLRERLSFPPRGEEDALPTNVVIRTEDGAVSLLVDEIGDVLEMDEELFEHPPENMGKEARQMIKGVYKLNDNLLLHLDIHRTIDISATLPSAA